jgi:hypothetical protein
VSSQTLIENHEFSNIWMKKKKKKKKEIWVIQICVTKKKKKKMMIMKKIWVQIWSLGEDFGQEMMRQWLQSCCCYCSCLFHVICAFFDFLTKKFAFFFPFLPCFWSLSFVFFFLFLWVFCLWFSLSNYFIIIKVYATFFFHLFFWV